MIGKLLHETWAKVVVTVLAPAVAWAAWLLWTSLIALSLPDSVAYSEDVDPLAAADSALLAALKELSDKEQERHELWLCDELDEELQAFYDRKDAGEALPERDTDRMEFIKTRMGENGYRCYRFED